MKNTSEDMGHLLVSFVIPVKNEETHIEACISSIRQRCPAGISYEMIVVDNGSTDSTVRILGELGVEKILFSSGRIGECRNVGARRAKGEVLIFIDGDVELTAEWSAGIAAELERIRNQSVREISGSWYRTTMASPVERHWFEPMAFGVKSHMNGGHLIVTRELFEEIGGFSAELGTGEDYEFCERAKKIGFKIRNSEQLVTIHLGYPRTLSGFFFREMWHGKGSYQSLGLFLRSKMALACNAFTYLAAFLLLAGLILKSGLLVGAAFVTYLAASLLLILHTYKSLSVSSLPWQVVFACTYMFARTLAGIPGAAYLAQQFRVK